MKKLAVVSVLFAALLIGFPGGAMAGKFPDKPITVIVPWKPGGGTDILARAVTPIWEKELGVTMVILNKPGGNNIVGYRAMFDAPHDGYTLVLGQSPNYNINVLFQKAPYKIEDILFLNMFQRDDSLFYANKDAPWKSLADLVKDAKKRPGKIKIGVAATKGMDPVYLKEFEQKAGVKFGEIIPMGGGGPLRREVIGGHMMLALHGAWVARKAQGLVRGLGVRRMEPSPIWPEAQIFNDVIPPANRYKPEDIQTLPTFIKGFAVPADVLEKYPDRVRTLVTTFEKAIKRQDWAEMIKKQQLETAFSYYSMKETGKIVNAFTKMLLDNRELFEKKKK